MARRFGFKPSLREQQLANARAMEFLAGAAPGSKRESAAAFAAAATASVRPAPKPRRKRTVADGPSEHQHQAALIQWWGLNCKRFGMPHYALFAIPNGGARDPITGARLKAEGVRKGVYDLMLAVPWRGAYGLFIEMKIRPNLPRDEQITFGRFLEAMGYGNAVCYSTEEAIAVIEEYFA